MTDVRIFLGSKRHDAQSLAEFDHGQSNQSQSESTELLVEIPVTIVIGGKSERRTSRDSAPSLPELTDQCQREDANCCVVGLHIEQDTDATADDEDTSWRIDGFVG